MIRSFLFLTIIFLLISCKAWAYTQEDCIRCHGEEGKGSVLHISLTEFRNSVHGSEFTCQDCHRGVLDERHELIKGSGAVDCDECHDQENLHGISAENRERPQCYSCHGKHDILGKDNRASMVSQDRLKDTCKGCHPQECDETGYIEWLPSLQIRSHKKQDFSRDYSRSNCIGCHQGLAAHGEEGPVDDQDCHVCHMDLKGREALMGYIHPGMDSGPRPMILSAGVVYQLFILVLLWGGYRFASKKLSGKRRR